MLLSIIITLATLKNWKRKTLNVGDGSWHLCNFLTISSIAMYNKVRCLLRHIWHQYCNLTWSCGLLCVKNHIMLLCQFGVFKNVLYTTPTPLVSSFHVSKYLGQFNTNYIIFRNVKKNFPKIFFQKELFFRKKIKEFDGTFGNTSFVKMEFSNIN